MGEQFIDLFTAGAYALVARMYLALASPSLSWLFLVLAAGGILFSLMESAFEQRPDLWLRHLIAVALGAVLTLMPQQVDLTALTYGAPGRIEAIFGTHSGAAPHLTYWIERLGSAAAVSLRSLTHQQAVFTVPGVAAQVDEIASDPATVNDAQLKANLEIWRRRVLPQILQAYPDFADRIRAAQLDSALRNPTPDAPAIVGPGAAAKSRAVQAALADANIDLPTMLKLEAPMLNEIASNAGATPWRIGTQGDDASDIRFSQRTSAANRSDETGNAFGDALRHADMLVDELDAQLPQSNNVVGVRAADQLYDLLGRSILYNAGVSISHSQALRGAIGSLCQRSGDGDCRLALSPVVVAASRLRVPDADRYNTGGWTTRVEQPITTTLLTITSSVLLTLSSLVVSVLPFALGVAKAMAIVISVLGAWLLLWPGRARIALSWMLGPISFVTLWTVFFNIWADIEPALSQIGSVAGDAENGSWSAGRAMSIAISLGYLGLPSLALGVIYGESGRALYHASARLETALMLAWHTRGTIASFGRRWLVNSPLARRWNQRAYRAVGLGTLRPPRSPGPSPTRRRPPGAAGGPARGPASATASATAGRGPSATSVSVQTFGQSTRQSELPLSASVPPDASKRKRTKKSAQDTDPPAP